jgi:hypothetical protein
MRYHRLASLPLRRMTWSAAEKCWIVYPKRSTKGRGKQASAPVMEEHVCHPYCNNQLQIAYNRAKARQNAKNPDPILGLGNEEPVALQQARQAAQIYK